MQLTPEYFPLTYKDFAYITESLDNIKPLEKQIKVTKVTLTEDEQTLFCLTMAQSDLVHFRLLV